MRGTFTAAILCCLLLAGCGQAAGSAAETTANTATLFAMDTVMDLTVYGEASLLDEAESRVSGLEALFSVTEETSEIYQLDHTGSCVLSDDTAALLKQALGLCERTDGALDLSIYPVVRAWGFTTGEYQVPAPETLSALLEKVDYRTIAYDAQTRTVSLPDGMEIDLGSVAKGYTSNALIALLRENGVTSALLNLGGNVHALGGKPDGSPWRVGIQNPQGNGYFGVLDIRDQAVITSGGYERYFEQDGKTYWHIIDPATGCPAESGLLSVTIVGDDGVVCDGLSTALFVMGLDDAAAFWRASDDFEAIFLDEDGNVTITEGLEGTFSLAEPDAQSELTVLHRE